MVPHFLARVADAGHETVSSEVDVSVHDHGGGEAARRCGLSGSPRDLQCRPAAAAAPAALGLQGVFPRSAVSEDLGTGVPVTGFPVLRVSGEPVRLPAKRCEGEAPAFLLMEFLYFSHETG